MDITEFLDNINYNGTDFKLCGAFHKYYINLFKHVEFASIEDLLIAAALNFSVQQLSTRALKPNNISCILHINNDPIPYCPAAFLRANRHMEPHLYSTNCLSATTNEQIKNSLSTNLNDEILHVNMHSDFGTLLSKLNSNNKNIGLLHLVSEISIEEISNLLTLSAEYTDIIAVDNYVNILDEVNSNYKCIQKNVFGDRTIAIYRKNLLPAAGVIT